MGAKPWTGHGGLARRSRGVSLVQYVLVGVAVITGVYVLVRVASLAYFRSKQEYDKTR